MRVYRSVLLFTGEGKGLGQRPEHRSTNRKRLTACLATHAGSIGSRAWIQGAVHGPGEHCHLISSDGSDRLTQLLSKGSRDMPQGGGAIWLCSFSSAWDNYGTSIVALQRFHFIGASISLSKLYCDYVLSKANVCPLFVKQG